MCGSPRWPRMVLTWLVVAAALPVVAEARAGNPHQYASESSPAAGPRGADAGGENKEQEKNEQEIRPAHPEGAPEGIEEELGRVFSQPGDSPPRPFVPLNPQTVEDRRRIQAIQLYVAARALESRREFDEAVELLKQARALDPDSVAIARRLSRLYLGVLGRPDLAVELGKQVLQSDPDDTETLSRLVEYYNRANDPRSCEALLTGVLQNPNLAPHSAGRLVAQFELGRLYSARLGQMEKAAAAFAEVVKELDDKSSNRLSMAEQARILGNDPASAYLNFGIVFIAAQQYDLAVRALERGLAYDEENPQIPLLLAETLLILKQGDRALALVDRYIQRQPQSLEAYELLAKVLKELNREDQITPRLEEAARRDASNVTLQYVLADRYRETGEAEKAEAIYQKLLATEPTPQTYRALAASLLKRKKAADLLRVVCEAMGRPNGLEAVSPQLQAAAADDELAEAMLDEGLKQLQADPPGLPRTAYVVLGFIANPERGANQTRRLERLLELQRLLLRQNPSAQAYRELADTLRRLQRFEEAAQSIEQMMENYPNERTPRHLVIVSDLLRQAGQLDRALEAARKAADLDPKESEAKLRLAMLLGDAGKLDEAVRVYRELIQNEPNNPIHELMLGGLLARFDRNEEAIKLFEDLLRRYASNEEVVKLARSNLSIIYVNQGDYAKGEAELEILYERSPDDPGINNDLGYLYAEQGKNLEKAEMMIRKAIQEEPDRAAYLDSLGWVLFKQGKVKEALEPLKRAVELQEEEERTRGVPADATIREHLGDVYLQLQQIEEARRIWEEAERIAARSIPPDRRLPEIRKKLDSLRSLTATPRTSSGDAP
jgi:tetratricopeptide (TPR) repeat protein